MKGSNNVIMAEQSTEHQRIAQEGVALCRAGDWRRGMELLRSVASADDRSGELPGVFYSYLGFGVARFDRHYKEGLSLCQHAIKREFYNPENYLNLAQTYLLAGDRGGAVSAIRDGLKIDSNHQDLRDLQRDLGFRREPVFPFLNRDNILNRILGKIRHSLSPPGGSPGDSA
jgi:hypothetical protein